MYLTIELFPLVKISQQIKKANLFGSSPPVTPDKASSSLKEQDILCI